MSIRYIRYTWVVRETRWIGDGDSHREGMMHVCKKIESKEDLSPLREMCYHESSHFSHKPP